MDYLKEKCVSALNRYLDDHPETSGVVLDNKMLLGCVETQFVTKAEAAVQVNLPAVLQSREYVRCDRSIAAHRYRVCDFMMKGECLCCQVKLSASLLFWRI